MSDDSKKKLRRIYDVLFSTLLTVTGIALAVACVQIYRSGERPFSPASIELHFRSISLLVYGTIIGIVIGLLLDIVLPRSTDRPKPIIHEDVRLARQLKKGAPTDSYADQIHTERRLRRKYGLVTAATFVLLMVFPVIYFTDITHFTVAALNRDVIVALAIALIPGITGLGLCLVCCHLWSKSYLRELAICKEAAKVGAITAEATKPRRKPAIRFLRLGIGILAVVSIVAGILNGGASDVLLKAIAICTECIGLG